MAIVTENTDKHALKGNFFGESRRSANVLIKPEENAIEIAMYYPEKSVMGTSIEAPSIRNLIIQLDTTGKLILSLKEVPFERTNDGVWFPYQKKPYEKFEIDISNDTAKRRQTLKDISTVLGNIARVVPPQVQ